MTTFVVNIEVNEEQLRAGNFALSPHRSADIMGYDEMVQFHLKPALEARLQSMVDNMHWVEKGYYCHPKKYGGNRHVSKPREGSQVCDNSPTPRCWYDAQKDPRWDSCLFCGDPHERK